MVMWPVSITVGLRVIRIRFKTQIKHGNLKEEEA
jgi:hypothetical protein